MELVLKSLHSRKSDHAKYEEFIELFSRTRQTAHFGGPIHGIPAKVLAVGIDLSDSGFPIGAKVEGLFLQDASDDNDSFDPVFIAGLPPIP